MLDRKRAFLLRIPMRVLIARSLLNVLLAVVCAGLGAWAQAVAPPLAKPLEDSLSSVDRDTENELLRLLNSERTKHGLKELVVDERLQAIARAHSARMSVKGDGTGATVEDETPEIRLRNAGIHFSRSAENVAVAADAAMANDGFMESPTPRANVLDSDFDAVGVGVIRGDQAIYVTEEFALLTENLSIEAAEELVVEQFNTLRKAAGMRPLKMLRAPKLRQCVCAMAERDKIDPAMCSPFGKYAVSGSHGAHVVAYTTADILKLPDTLTRYKKNDDFKISVGICYASSPSVPNPAYWVAVMIYLRNAGGGGVEWPGGPSTTNERR